MHAHVDDSSTVEDILTSGLELLTSMTLGLVDADGDRITARPGSNANVHYIAEQFALRDFCWCDFGQDWSDEPADPAGSIHSTPDGFCPPNFEHPASGLKATWYKHMGRSLEWTNLPETRAEAMKILLDCMSPLVAGKPSLPRNDLKAR